MRTRTDLGGLPYYEREQRLSPNAKRLLDTTWRHFASELLPDFWRFGFGRPGVFH